MNVLISSKALARERSRSATISGTIPYLAGLNTVECSAIRNSTTSISSIRVEQNAAIPSAMIRISNPLTEISTVRLLSVSASRPE